MDQWKSNNITRKEDKRHIQNELEAEREEWTSFTGDESVVKLKASEMYCDNSESSDWKEDEETTLSYSSSKWFSASEAETLENTQPRLINSREELAKIWLSRLKLERFLNLPLFERTVLNCFVSICVGTNGKQQVYRVAEIVGVVETARIYNCGKTNTNKRLRLKHGSNEQVFPLEFIANIDFTESEFLVWRETCIQQNVEMPSSSLIEKKVADIQEALNLELSVNRIIDEINKLQHGSMKKIFLTKLRVSAMLRGYYELSQVLYQQIEKLGSSIHNKDEDYAIFEESFVNLKTSVICSVDSESSDWEEDENHATKYIPPYNSRKWFSESETEDYIYNNERNRNHYASVHLKASKLCSDDSDSSDWEEDEETALSYGSSKCSSVSETDELEETLPRLINELNKIRLSRFKLERFINLPLFERTVLNCFVRICVGTNGKKQVYRLAEIVGIVETAKAYNFGKTETNKVLRLKLGSNESVFRLDCISNWDFTDREFLEWRESCIQQSVPMPTADLIVKKLNEIEEALNFKCNVNKIIDQKQSF